jgi:PIN domain nuclease of toxin-antitoxin system
MDRHIVVLDTHTAVWWSQSPELLGAKARTAIESVEIVSLPSIVFWEVSLLIRRKRLALKGGRSAGEWAEELLSIPRVRESPLTALLALRADALDMHHDPADRFIAATALSLDAPLVTKDELLTSLPWLSTLW